jgi:arginase family enzyme
MMDYAELAIHWNLDSAWEPLTLGVRTTKLLHLGPMVRYLATANQIQEFVEFNKRTRGDARFVLYGSGDFHHLAGMRLRQLTEQVVVVSFDNHPDWDIRPPAWSCGGWLSRSVGLPNVKRATVWGCGNFELRRPARLFADRAALREGRLQINAWAERQPLAVQRRWNCMTRENWRDRFSAFAASVAGETLYVTVDLDCLAEGESVTNWENGLFTADDVAWAISMLRERAKIIGGDLCGAYSPPSYDRPMQRLAGWWDHPKLPAIDIAEARRINVRALERIWPALILNSATQSRSQR